jgi:HlyD family secretion protein
MDRVIEKKGFSPKVYYSIGGVLLFALLTYAFVSSTAESSYRISSDKLRIATVANENFEESIPINGTVEPKHSVQIDASEGGVVEALLVEDGTFVQQGQPIVKLNNKALTLDFMNRETQIVEQINNLRSTRITLDQNKRQVQEQLVDQRYQLQEQQRQFNINQSLYSDSVISSEEFEASRTALAYLNERVALLEERSKTDELYRASQLENIDASIDMMQRNLQAIKQNLEDLTVKAPIAGQLNGFDMQLGETKQRGELIARVDDTTGFRIRAQVDQYYLNRITNGQAAIMTISGHAYDLTVSRILPTVVNNQFEVILQFEDENPPTVRRGQNVSIKLLLSAATKALVLKKGAFYQESGGKYVFVVQEDGTAVKRDIVLGAQNTTHYQVIEGLESGEEVVISAYTNFSNIEKLILESSDYD